MARHYPFRDQGDDGLTLQNRVLPKGEIVADPALGTLMGNRGILHDENQKLGTFRWTHPHWVTCPLEFKGRKHALMTPGRYKELFFLDEDTALAAGHRPCGKCRRTEFRAFTQAFHAANGTSTLRELDQQLHRARVTRSRAQVRCDADASNLPDGTFILVDHRQHLLWQNQALPYSPAG